MSGSTFLLGRDPRTGAAVGRPLAAPMVSGRGGGMQNAPLTLFQRFQAFEPTKRVGYGDERVDMHDIMQAYQGRELVYPSSAFTAEILNSTANPFLAAVAPLMETDELNLMVTRTERAVHLYDEVTPDGVPRATGRERSTEAYTLSAFKRTETTHMEMLLDPNHGPDVLFEMNGALVFDTQLTLAYFAAVACVEIPWREMVSRFQRDSTKTRFETSMQLHTESTAFALLNKEPSDFINKIERLRTPAHPFNLVILPHGAGSLIREVAKQARNLKLHTIQAQAAINGTYDILDVVYEGPLTVGSVTVGTGDMIDFIECPEFHVSVNEGITLTDPTMSYPVLGEVVFQNVIDPNEHHTNYQRGSRRIDPIVHDQTPTRIVHRPLRYRDALSACGIWNNSDGSIVPPGRFSDAYTALITEMNNDANRETVLRRMETNNETNINGKPTYNDSAYRNYFGFVGYKVVKEKNKERKVFAAAERIGSVAPSALPKDHLVAAGRLLLNALKDDDLRSQFIERMSNDGKDVNHARRLLADVARPAVPISDEMIKERKVAKEVEEKKAALQALINGLAEIAKRADRDDKLTKEDKAAIKKLIEPVRDIKLRINANNVDRYDEDINALKKMQDDIENILKDPDVSLAMPSHPFAHEARVLASVNSVPDLQGVVDDLPVGSAFRESLAGVPDTHLMAYTNLYKTMLGKRHPDAAADPNHASNNAMKHVVSLAKTYGGTNAFGVFLNKATAAVEKSTHLEGIEGETFVPAKARESIKKLEDRHMSIGRALASSVDDAMDVDAPPIRTTAASLMGHRGVDFGAIYDAVDIPNYFADDIFLQANLTRASDWLLPAQHTAAIQALLLLPNHLNVHEQLSTAFGIHLMRFNFYRITQRYAMRSVTAMVAGAETLFTAFGHASLRPRIEGISGNISLDAYFRTAVIPRNKQAMEILPYSFCHSLRSDINTNFVRSAAEFRKSSDRSKPSVLVGVVPLDEDTYNTPFDMLNRDTDTPENYQRRHSDLGLIRHFIGKGLLDAEAAKLETSFTNSGSQQPDRAMSLVVNRSWAMYNTSLDGFSDVPGDGPRAMRACNNMEAGPVWGGERARFIPGGSVSLAF